ncbi:uncharacterized protein OCT59_014939 [Rhizophagus irregularis]|uniref:uncharacterized protein n=1 Tax=Rhizophagus irregularis TaxID=588596 RepID=UPI000CAB5767|nr:hypothetical protein OCT59_014939 [Rhizophagus irregularis]
MLRTSTYYLREVVNCFKDWIEYNGDLPKAVSNKELADIIRVYKEDRNAEIIPTPLEIVQSLLTRPDIKELQYSGARFSRRAIARLEQQLQSRYPTHKFQILLPYENWKPGG